MTTAKYYTPSERVIHENGIEPDVVVPMSVENWRNILLARNKAEEKNGDGQESAPTDEGWVDEEGTEIPLLAPAGKAEPELVDLDKVIDPQLDRAADMLRGILVFQGR